MHYEFVKSKQLSYVFMIWAEQIQQSTSNDRTTELWNWGVLSLEDSKIDQPDE